MGTMNHNRAVWAFTALEAFCSMTGQNARTEKAEAVGDLICDLLHVAGQNGFDAEALAQRALSTYEAEVADDE